MLIQAFLDLENGLCRAMLRGIRQYATENRGCTLRTTRRSEMVLSRVARNLSGAIAFASTETCADFQQLIGVPVVQVSGRSKPGLVPSVLPDNYQIGQLGARHLLERGFRHLAFTADKFYFSSQRAAGFLDTVREAGATGYPLGPGPLTDMVAWVRSIGGPAAWMAESDYTAAQPMLGLVDAGVRIPEDLAVVGVDNDDVMCECQNVPLSSVDPNGERIGREAAALLHRLIDGKPIEQQHVVVPPISVVTRLSSDIIATRDEVLAEALRYIHENACNRITVEDILDKVPVSRRKLERRFRAEFGRTLHEEIQRVRFEHGRRLLATTSLTLAEVADRLGFFTVNRFTTMFKIHVGVPPGAYRRKHR